MTPLLSRWREDSPIREAAWIARCVGDPTTTPLTEADLNALGTYLRPPEFDRGAPVFRAGERRTIAAMLGVQRPSLNKILKDLENKGLITLGYGQIQIKDPAGLGAQAH